MSSELLINVTPAETRVALVEQGILQEVHVERQANMGLVSNVYKGKVTRVLPGMQAAFVDIGLEKAAFLHATDIVPHTECVDDDEKANFKPRSISSLISDGEHLLVQVLRDQISTKGARITTDISLPSRYLVYIPGNSKAGDDPSGARVGVSQRISTPQERLRLKKIVSGFLKDGETDGFIVRTAAEGASEEELLQDAHFLRCIWEDTKEKYKKEQRDRALLLENLPLAFRVLRDFVDTNVDRILIDSRETCAELKNYCSKFMPEMAEHIELYAGKEPIFDMYDVENEIHRALERKVMLKSGGSLVIDQTEAMTTIDINTGSFVGRRNQEETIFNTNMEATTAIARQLRLRNLGGIIIIDFIDMDDEEHRKKVLARLEEALKSDRVKTKVYDFSPLGLVEMTRKRTRESLGRVLCCECPLCAGKGRIKSVETVCSEILREVTRMHKSYAADKYMVYASSEVAEEFRNDGQHNIAELEVFLGREIEVSPEPLYTREQFRVVLM